MDTPLFGLAAALVGGGLTALVIIVIPYVLTKRRERRQIRDIIKRLYED